MLLNGAQSRIVVALLWLVALGCTGCATAGDDSRPDAGTSACDHVAVQPGADVTSALSGALSHASQNPVAGVVGPRGAAQGRVYLAPGSYGLRSLNVPDNVRIEIAPGATLHPVEEFDPNQNNDWGLLVFGDANRPARNISIVAGDGCGGPGSPTSQNKPANTGFRGNDPDHGGMANAEVPFRPEWDTAAMWVMDLDPAEYDAGAQVTGFYFRWAYDIDIADIFTIQNAARAEVGIAPVSGATSRTAAMMFDPPNDASWVSDPEMQVLPHRVRVTRHYNILSPSGQGPNQIRACIDCEFREIFSHGGVALRVETDGIRTIDLGCSNTGEDQQGFREFAIVTGLVAERIEGAYGNRVAMFTPHCLPNGTVEVRDVRGTSMGELVVVAGSQAGAPSGGFSSIHIEDVWGCGGALAQEPYPEEPYNSYLPAPSRAAAGIVADWVDLTGTWSWPPSGAAGGLIDGLFPAGHSVTVVPPVACP